MSRKKASRNVASEKSTPKKFEAKNSVSLIGRVSAAGVERVLPSGDKVVEFRIVVDRNPAKQVSHSNKALNSNGSVPSLKRRSLKREIDSLDIAAWSAKSRRSALALKCEQWVEISGAVRRRFWQAPSGLASRWQVEAHSITRLQ